MIKCSELKERVQWADVVCMYSKDLNTYVEINKWHFLFSLSGYALQYELDFEWNRVANTIDNKTTLYLKKIHQ